jgi:hypothetical protein
VIWLAAGVASALLGGCGSATTTTSARSTTTTRPARTPAAGTTTATSASRPSTASTIPPGAVALAAGRPITRSVFAHWMYVAAKSQAAEAPGQPVIAPSDPPSFDRCIAQVRKRIPSLAKSRTSVLRADCGQLFRSLSTQVMDFPIKSHWYQAEATKLGLTPTAAQVQHTFDTARKQQFPTESGFQAFLAKTGQTVADIQFRFQINLIVTRLTAREKGKESARASAVDRLVTRAYRPTTLCAPTVMMADCGRSA